MQLKINYYILFSIIFLVSQTYSQEKPVLLFGNVKYNSLNIPDINIINKTSNIGTSSNENGEFNITAKKGDSIMFSSLEYQNRTIAITENHINSKSITVYLEPGFNELNEVEILQKMRLDFNNVTVDRRTVLDNDKINSSKPPDIDKYLNKGYMTNGVSLIGIYNLLTKNSRAKKRTANAEKREIEIFKKELPNTLKKLYGIEFFTDWLYIHENEVDLFLEYCQENGLSDYYNSNEFVIKNFLVVQSNKYNKLKN